MADDEVVTEEKTDEEIIEEISNDLKYFIKSIVPNSIYKNETDPISDDIGMSEVAHELRYFIKSIVPNSVYDDIPNPKPEYDDYVYLNDASKYITLDSAYTLVSSELIKMGKLVQLTFSIKNATTSISTGVKNIGSLDKEIAPKSMANSGIIGSTGSITADILNDANGVPNIRFRVGTTVAQNVAIPVTFIYFI